MIITKLNKEIHPSKPSNPPVMTARVRCFGIAVGTVSALHVPHLSLLVPTAIAAAAEQPKPTSAAVPSFSATVTVLFVENLGLVGYGWLSLSLLSILSTLFFFLF